MSEGLGKGDQTDLTWSITWFSLGSLVCGCLESCPSAAAATCTGFSGSGTFVCVCWVVEDVGVVVLWLSVCKSVLEIVLRPGIETFPRPLNVA